MHLFSEWIEWINREIVWGIPMLLLLLGTGIFLTIRLRFFPIRKIKLVFQSTIGRAMHKDNRNEKVSPFQAMCAALAGTIGTGNIAGVAGAIAIGGAGTVFWMWICALLGMTTKYTEVVLAVRYRECNVNGEYVGGPMYYIKNGLGKKFAWLGAMFCVFGVFASFGIGNMAQIHTIATSAERAVAAFATLTPGQSIWIRFLIGSSSCLLAVGVLMGGMTAIGRVTERIVPLMSLLYILIAFYVVIVYRNWIGVVFGQIITGAFTPNAFLGTGVFVTVKTGIERGVFSNEAGLGSAPIAHACAETNSPVEQGFYGIVEVFIVTIVICTLTALVILLPAASNTGFIIPYGTDAGAELTIEAISTALDHRLAGILLFSALTLFALSTIFTWGLYGSRCVEYLFGVHAGKIYRLIFCLLTICGALMRIELVWNLSDLFNALMAIPNLIALLALNGTAVQITEAFRSKRGLK